MNDEEKTAARAAWIVTRPMYGSHNVPEGYFQQGFAAGIQWRDENPSPKVQALVEALKKIASPPTREEADHPDPSYSAETRAAKALAAWSKK